MSKNIAIIISKGVEDVEFVAAYDLLLRAQAQVTVVSLDTQTTVKTSHGLTIEANGLVDTLDAEKFDAYVIPGGALDLDKYIALAPQLQQLLDANKHLCAICAAPTALARAGLINGKQATCYPSMSADLTNNQVTYHNKAVVVDGKLVTGHGPAAAFEFALEVIRQVLGDQAYQNVVNQTRYQLND